MPGVVAPGRSLRLVPGNAPHLVASEAGHRPNGWTHHQLHTSLPADPLLRICRASCVLSGMWLHDAAASASGARRGED